MNKTALAIIVCSMFALPANADTISGGKITSVDAGGTSFHYSKKEEALDVQDYRQDRHSGRKQNRHFV